MSYSVNDKIRPMLANFASFAYQTERISENTVNRFNLCLLIYSLTTLTNLSEHRDIVDGRTKGNKFRDFGRIIFLLELLRSLLLSKLQRGYLRVIVGFLNTQKSSYRGESYAFQNRRDNNR